MPTADPARTVAIPGPTGDPVEVDVVYDPATDPAAGATDPRTLGALLEAEGFALARGLLSPARCAELIAAFRAEVKPARAPFYRHETDHPEAHVFTADGFMKHPVLNPHELWSRRYGRTRRLSQALLADLALQRLMEGLFGEPGKLIHSMYFEGNQKTWAHRDTYYVDSTRLGAMVGVWIALEDIHPGAGRFYVYPRSHRLPVPELGDGFAADPNEPDYKARVLGEIARSGLKCHAPALRAGDVLLFGSRTIHGSLPNPESGKSRNALTGHFIPVSHGIVWFHRDVRPERSRVIDGLTVHFNKDLDLPANRLALYREALATAALKRARALKARLQA
ncbi:MAG: phytanoyl-CoA dioxygenase family protein [Candidatus Sericytochromatia bacterium]|nr:phytanoyl-CoA dioxygenase family protein [Candidatus Tanganyikabacteria bacterium]